MLKPAAIVRLSGPGGNKARKRATTANHRLRAAFDNARIGKELPGLIFNNTDNALNISHVGAEVFRHGVCYSSFIWQSFPQASMNNIDPLQKNTAATGYNLWEPWQINLLLDCVAANQHVSISLQNSERILQSVVIGFDLTRSTLLLDTIYPCSVSEMEALQRQKIPLVISVPVKDVGETLYYNLIVHIIDIHSGTEGFMTEVLVESVDVSSRRRRDSRVHFDKPSRPAIALVSGDLQKINGRLCNLSRYGCLMEFFGEDLSRKLQNQPLSLNIHFNSQFDISLRGFVVQARFSKRPSYHNRLHIQFCQVDNEVQQQIDGFIASVVFRSQSLLAPRFQSDQQLSAG